MHADRISLGVGNCVRRDLSWELRRWKGWGAFFKTAGLFATIWNVIAGGASLYAQGTITPLQTGSGQALVSQQEVLQLAGTVNPTLVFDLGFVTDEIPVPSAFLDSFTVTLQDTLESVTAVLATLDASGVVWAPPSPGALVLPDSQIQRQAIPPSSLAPVNGRGTAFAVHMAVPAQFTGATVVVSFDLFDNQNQAMSLGWYSSLQLISVPEPQVWSLIGLGCLVWRLSKKYRNR